MQTCQMYYNWLRWAYSKATSRNKKQREWDKEREGRKRERDGESVRGVAKTGIINQFRSPKDYIYNQNTEETTVCWWKEHATTSVLQWIEALQSHWEEDTVRYLFIECRHYVTRGTIQDSSLVRLLLSSSLQFTVT